MSAMKEKIYQYTYERLQSGDPPTIREVQRAMGLKAVESARAHLEALVEEGRLVKRPTRSRSYALPPEIRVEARKVPIVGQVQAGALTTAWQEVEGHVTTGRVKRGEELFALRVRGESMREAGILEGDLVIARRQSTAEVGEIVVALVEEEATVKRLAKAKGKVLLMPENSEFEPIEVAPEQLQLLGKVVEVRRYYEVLP